MMAEDVQGDGQIQSHDEWTNNPATDKENDSRQGRRANRMVPQKFRCNVTGHPTQKKDRGQVSYTVSPSRHLFVGGRMGVGKKIKTCQDEQYPQRSKGLHDNSAQGDVCSLKKLMDTERAEWRLGQPSRQQIANSR